jgi:hypothetical protein
VAIVAGPLLVAAHPTVDTLTYFAAPMMAMGVALLMAGRRFNPRLMAGRHAVLCLSVVLPLLVFMTPWIAAGAVGDLLDGLFIRPKIRLASAAYYPGPPTVFALLAVPPLAACLCAGAARPLRRVGWAATGFTVALLGIGLTARQPSGFVAPAMMAALEGWRWFPALGCPALVCLLVRCRPQEGGLPAAGFAVAAMTSFFALNQYPFASPIYFLFVWPLVALLVIALAAAAADGRTVAGSTAAARSSPLLLSSVARRAPCRTARPARWPSVIWRPVLTHCGRSDVMLVCRGDENVHVQEPRHGKSGRFTTSAETGRRS